MLRIASDRCIQLQYFGKRVFAAFTEDTKFATDLYIELNKILKASDSCKIQSLIIQQKMKTFGVIGLYTYT